MLKITDRLFLDEAELDFKFIRSPGPGGQNVNKVATGVELRFAALPSPYLPDPVKIRLIRIAGSKLSSQGIIIIKATRYRTQERNKQDAISRLCDLLKHAATIPKKRKKTKPTKTSIEKRISTKKRHGKAKSLRQRPDHKE